jgi:hypothetical protein
MEVADNELPSAQLAIHVTSEGGGLPWLDDDNIWTSLD